MRRTATTLARSSGRWIRACERLGQCNLHEPHEDTGLKLLFIQRVVDDVAARVETRHTE